MINWGQEIKNHSNNNYLVSKWIQVWQGVAAQLTDNVPWHLSEWSHGWRKEEEQARKQTNPNSHKFGGSVDRTQGIKRRPPRDAAGGRVSEVEGLTGEFRRVPARRRHPGGRRVGSDDGTGERAWCWDGPPAGAVPSWRAGAERRVGGVRRPPGRSVGG